MPKVIHFIFGTNDGEICKQCLLGLPEELSVQGQIPSTLWLLKKKFLQPLRSF